MRGNRLGGPARTTPIARATMPPRTSPKDAWGWAAGRHAVRPPGAMDKIERAVDDIRRKWAPDSRLAVFEISLLPKGVAGVTSSRDARDALRRLAGESQLVAEVVRRRALSVGRAHGMGDRLLRARAGCLQCARHQAAARQRSAIRARQGDRAVAGWRGGGPSVWR